MNLPLKRWKSCVCQWNLRPSDDFIAREWRSPKKYLSTSSNACEFFSFSNCLQLTFQVMRCLRFWFVRCEHVRLSFWEGESQTSRTKCFTSRLGAMIADRLPIATSLSWFTEIVTALTTVEFRSVWDEHGEWSWAAWNARYSKYLIARILTNFQVIFV